MEDHFVKPRSKSARPETIDDYLAPLSDDKRAALQKLRKTIRSAAPGAKECIAYGIPAFRVQGRMLLAFGAAAKHCACYPGALPVRVLQTELADYSTSKGTIRFKADAPLPPALVRKLVKARVAEHAGGKPAARRGGKRRR
jgi:uncharacterized protein YdhG (YjbR/CyaY superfamily)